MGLSASYKTAHAPRKTPPSKVAAPVIDPVKKPMAAIGDAAFEVALAAAALVADEKAEPTAPRNQKK